MFRVLLFMNKGDETVSSINVHMLLLTLYLNA